MEEKTREFGKSVVKEHQEKLHNILSVFQDVFKDQLPKGPHPKREVTHSIGVQTGSELTYRTPYRLHPTEQDEFNE